MTKLSIVICTYNRADILKYCLDSLIKQNVSNDIFEIIIVDNNSNDNTKEISLFFHDKFIHFQYIIEKQVGLSYARNTGYKNAKADWVAYIDDDAIAHTNYIEKVISACENYDFDVFGGGYNPWYLFGKKKWLPDSFGKSTLKDKHLETGYFSGLNMVFKKDVLERLNGFNTNLGMTGNKVAYGEETELQDRLRQKGYKIGYAPDVVVDHLVGKHKLTLSWHLKSSYAYGRDNFRMWRGSNPTFFYVFKTTINSIVKLPKLLHQILNKKNYYWQNAWLDFFKPICQSFGEFYEYKRQKKQKI